MPKVKFTVPVRFNLTGYDREPLAYPAGIHEVPDAVAAYIAANPGLGEVVQETPRPRGKGRGQEQEAESQAEAADGAE